MDNAPLISSIPDNTNRAGSIETFTDPPHTESGNPHLSTAPNFTDYMIPTQFPENTTWEFTIGHSGQTAFAGPHRNDVQLLTVGDVLILFRTGGVTTHGEGGGTWFIFNPVIFEYTIPAGAALQTFKIGIQKRAGAGDVALNFYHASRIR